MKIFIGVLSTAHFEFLSTGFTMKECKDKMETGWKAHCKQFGAENNWEHFEDSCYYLETEVGQVLRDGCVIA